MSENNSERKDCIIKIKKPFFIKENKIKKRMDEVFFIIYKTTNLLKGENEPCRFYVGQHIQYNINPYEFDGYLGSGDIIINSVKKYGEENFIRETLEVCKSLEHMNEREIFWIEELKANFKKYPECGGMNLVTVSSGMFKGCRKRDVSGKNNPMFGRNHTEKSRKKMSENHRDCSGEKNHRFGKSLSESTKNKISEKAKNRKNNDKISNFLYFLSNGENYWEVFNKKEREYIANKMRIKKWDEIEYKGIIIKRVLKEGKNRVSKVNDEKELKPKKVIKKEIKKDPSKMSLYLYELSNNDDYWKVFDVKERQAIRDKMKYYNTNTIIYKGITITRTLKEKEQENDN